ncbi:hypothetical protein RintRC_1885 [Richelia intracellularis]|nr:hypothetical protein RintRC_1885 [Richelia intracellularis]
MQEAIASFYRALAKESQLPSTTVKQIQRERRNAAKNLKD